MNRKWPSRRNGLFGDRDQKLCVWFATDLLVLFPQSAAAAPSPVLGNIPPNDGMPGGPIPPGFFQVCSGLGPCAGQAGRRGQGRSLVCRGLNTVALCWLRPCCLTSPTSPKLQRRRERWEGVSFQAGCGCVLLSTLLSGEASASRPVWSYFFYNKSCILCLPHFFIE